MNTSKQINVMIGLLFLSFLAFGAYVLNEGNRADAARVTQEELLARRGAELFVANCRSCHGLEGLGTAEGGIAPALNAEHFLVVQEDNDLGLPPTPEGEARTVHNFLFNTISCGRTNTAMPVWSERYGGSLSETQVDYIVEMITQGRWDLVKELGEAHDEETGATRDTILITDPAALSLTTGNCGQFNLLTAKDIYARTPLQAPAPDGATPTATPAGTETPSGGGDDPANAVVQGLNVKDYYTASCSPCHGLQRQGIVGPALTPERLTESDQFYFDTIANGRQGTVMPSWRAAGLTDADIEALVQFLKHVPPD